MAALALHEDTHCELRSEVGVQTTALPLLTRQSLQLSSSNKRDAGLDHAKG